MEWAEVGASVMAKNECAWGLAAVGRAGACAVDVDVAMSGPERWQVALEWPRWHLRFEIPGPRAVTDLIEFLEAYDGKCVLAELRLGSLLGGKVSVVKDPEWPDAFRLQVAGEVTVMGLQLFEKDVRELIEALKQAADDLATMA